MNKGILKGIELGKIWMRNSLDISHDYTHVQKVEEHALQIYEELKPEDVTIEELKLAIWWHDSYKARCKTTSFDSIWNEGTKSIKIFEKEFKDKIPDEVLERVGRAIVSHNRAFYILFNHSKMDNLSMLLIEADQLDGLRKERVLADRKRIRNIFIYILDLFLTDFVPTFLKIIHRSKYTLEILKLNKTGKI